MRENWERSVALLFDSEGRELTVGGSEPGGASKLGVSVAALTDFRKSRGLGPASIDMVSSLTETDAAEFYQSVTARAIRFDELPPGVDYAMLDVTANLGPSGGPWLAQCVLGVWPQGNVMTGYMVAGLNDMPAEAAVYAITGAWLAKKRESSSWGRAGHGWTNRMTRVRGDALKMIGEKR
jgi:lysozyme family protein